jgi:predicted nucleotidyltransferase
VFTDNQIQILTVLTGHPAREYYLSELGAILKKHPGTFQRGLNSLQKRGLVLSRKKGNQRLFKINQAHPLFTEIKSIAQKTGGAEALLEAAVKKIKGIDAALIYGSYAKGVMRADSDVDILVVASDPETEDALLKEFGVIERRLQREVNYKIYAKNEFAKKMRNKDPFLTEVLSDKYILLKGKI